MTTTVLRRLRPRALSLLILLLVPLLTAVPTAEPVRAQQAAAADKPGLFINLTTDDTWAAGKAILFAHQRALKTGHKPVTIWLNVRAVYLADKKRASHVHGLLRQKNMSIQDMLKAFMADGGRVLACGACSAAAGLTKADYIDGIEMGEWPLVEALLFDPNVKTLSW